MKDIVSIASARSKHAEVEPLWRHMLGRRLRELRHDRGEHLTETAARAGISPQYLSEMERGRKEPSSEMIAAIAGALGSSLVDLTAGVAEDLRRTSQADRSTQPTSREQLSVSPNLLALAA